MPSLLHTIPYMYVHVYVCREAQLLSYLGGLVGRVPAMYAGDRGFKLRAVELFSLKLRTAD